MYPPMPPLLVGVVNPSAFLGCPVSGPSEHQAGKQDVSGAVADTLQRAQNCPPQLQLASGVSEGGRAGAKSVSDIYPFPVWVPSQGPFISSSVLFRMVDRTVAPTV